MPEVAASAPSISLKHATPSLQNFSTQQVGWPISGCSEGMQRGRSLYKVSTLPLPGILCCHPFRLILDDFYGSQAAYGSVVYDGSNILICGALYFCIWAMQERDHIFLLMP